MTVKELYSLCDNLGHSTRFTIRAGYPDKPVEVDISYMELAPYWETKITGFKIDDLRHCTIYI